MTKINELTLEQTLLLDALFFMDENSEDDAEEIARLKKALLKIRGDAYGTLEFLSGLLLESKALLAGREEVKKRAERRRKTAENACNRLTSVIEYMLRQFDIQKVDLDECSLRLQKSPGAVEFSDNFDYATLPHDCYKLEFKPLKSEIKAYLEAGAHIDGVSIVQKESLRIG